MNDYRNMSDNAKVYGVYHKPYTGSYYNAKTF